MSELQPGMLAMIIGARHCQENIGKIVEAVEINGDEVEVQGVGLIGYSEVKRAKSYTGKMWAIKSHLLPIKPEADPLDVNETQELHA